MKKSLADKDTTLAAVYGTLYDRAIDFGAHPNVGGLLMSLKDEKSSEQMRKLQVLLHGDGTALDSALLNTTEVGICALKIFGHIFQPRFESVGAFDKLKELEAGL